jgi:plastocyanin
MSLFGGAATRAGAFAVLVCVISLGTQRLYAFDLNLVLVDEQEQPVVGAVIEIAGSAGAPPSPELAIIDQIERRFVPMVLLVDAGQLVTFPNSDNVRHHVYSFSEVRQFSTPLYANEDIEPILFDRPGIAVLGCNIHDSMVAYVYVAGSAHRAISNEQGQLSIDGLPSNPGTVSVWHPWLQTTDNRMDVDTRALGSGETMKIVVPARSPETRFGFRALNPGAES